MTPDPPAPAAVPATRETPSLVFDWKHRPRTWHRLSFWLLLVLIGHLAGFVLFRVRTPAPARAMPVPAGIVLAPHRESSAADPDVPAPAAGLLSPAETADLELPEHASSLPHLPSFADHEIARQPWPARPERAAWPEVSAVSRPVLPPVQPSPPSERPADPPR